MFCSVATRKRNCATGTCIDMCTCVAVCCSVLQCVAVCCSVLQCVTVSVGGLCRDMMRRAHTYIGACVLQSVAVYVGGLRQDMTRHACVTNEHNPPRNRDKSEKTLYVLGCDNIPKRHARAYIHTCVLQRVATCCIVSQCVLQSNVGHARTCIYTYTYTFTYRHVYIYIYIHTYAHIHIELTYFPHAHTITYIYIYIHKYKSIHTYLHTNIHICTYKTDTRCTHTHAYT